MSVTSETGPRRSIWRATHERVVSIIDQTALPHRSSTLWLASLRDVESAIGDMRVRGAPLIGVTAAYGIAIALDAAREPSLTVAREAKMRLDATRPTAVNLRWATSRMCAKLADVAPRDLIERAFAEADAIAEEDVAASRAIGEHGARALEMLWRSKGADRPLEILTHCNAGYLATVSWGTALAPIYVLQERGIPIHVWVDETRPRNQGYLTAWELSEASIPNTVIVDNAGGHYLQRGRVDAVIVGSDRTTRNGDVCNKIGTLLKALAAKAYGVPFYVALPSSTLDFSLARGADIEIEERAPEEVHTFPWATAKNPAFDVTEAHLVTALITERGVFAADEASLREAFPDLARQAQKSE